MASDEIPTDVVAELELPPGELVAGRWRVEEVLGRGPHGTVHRVVDQTQGLGAAALKLITSASKDQPAFAARFERESKELAGLDSHRINRLIDFGWRKKSPWVVSELAGGRDLAQLLGPSGRLPLDQLLPLANQLCEAVAFIHQRAFVHRALKPRNIRVDEGGQLWVLDLLSGQEPARPALEDPDFSGDARYLAPEQLMAQPVDHRADLYALGAILFELATGRPPFVAADATSLVTQTLTVAAPNASVLFPDIPPAVASVLSRTLAKSPAARYASAGELRDALELAFSGEASQVAGPGAHVPQQVGRYKLIRKLATGGMAEVFLASSEGVGGFQKQVALKRILPALADDPKFVERFLKEARWVAKLNHPNIVQIFDAGQDNGTYFIAMEYVDGPNLRALANHLSKRGPLSIPICVRLAAYAAEGLGYAHNFRDPETGEATGLIHRDISPENILLANNGAVKVVDFGIAKAVDSKTRSTSLRGKYAYMAPEQIQWQRSEIRSDVYSLGVVLYELVCGKKPFDATTELAAMRAIVDEPPVPLSRRRPDAPERLEALLARSLDKRPEGRFQNCAEMAKALQALMAHWGVVPGPADLAKLVEDYNVGPGTASIIAVPDVPAPKRPSGEKPARLRTGERPTAIGPAPAKSPSGEIPPRRPTGEQLTAIGPSPSKRPSGEQRAPAQSDVTRIHRTGEVAVQELADTGKVGEFWKSRPRRQAAIVVMLALAGGWLVLMLSGVGKPDVQTRVFVDPDAEATRAAPRPMPSPREDPLDETTGAGGGAGSPVSAGAGTAEDAAKRKKLPIKGGKVPYEEDVRLKRLKMMNPR